MVGLHVIQHQQEGENVSENSKNMNYLSWDNPSVAMGKSSVLDARKHSSTRRWSDDHVGLGWDSIQECECGVDAKFCVCEGMECQRVPDLAREAKLDATGTEANGRSMQTEGQVHDAEGSQGPASAFDDMPRFFQSSSGRFDLAAGVSSRMSKLQVGGIDISPARARDIASTRNYHGASMDSNDELDISLPSSLSYTSLLQAQNLQTPDTSEDSSGRSGSTNNTNHSDDELSSRHEPVKERKRTMHRRSLSRWYNGKAKSFTSLADCYSLGSVQGLRKPENAGSKRRFSRNLEVFAKSLQGSYSLSSFEES